jgi:type IV pilus assembly protein PilC
MLLPPVPSKSPGSRKAVPSSSAAATTTGSPVTPKPRFRIASFRRVVSAKALAIFTRQLATLTKAGLPLMRALEVLGRHEKNSAFRAVVSRLMETIRAGGSFSDGLRRQPEVFDRLFVNMVRAGEAGGMLTAVLERLAMFMEKSGRTRGRIKSAMTYPVIIMILAGAIVGALMVMVVPRFQGIFAGMLKGQPLPALTEAILTLSNFLRGHAWAALSLPIATYVGLAWLRRTRQGTRVMDWAAIHAPLLGGIFLRAAIARFTRTFGTLLSSGVPILQALIITRDTAGNVHLAAAISVAHDRVKAGDALARPLEATRIFPAMVTSMIEVGEETGALPEMLNRIADTYDEEVDLAVASLTTLIEPLLIVAMAVIVGVVVIALFLPIIRIIQSLS